MDETKISPAEAESIFKREDFQDRILDLSKNKKTSVKTITERLPDALLNERQEKSRIRRVASAILPFLRENVRVRVDNVDDGYLVTVFIMGLGLVQFGIKQ